MGAGEVSDRRLEVGQALLGGLQIALRLVERLLVGRGINGRQRLRGCHGVARGHGQRRQLGGSTEPVEGQVGLLHRLDLTDDAHAGAEVAALHVHHLGVAAGRRRAGARAGAAAQEQVAARDDGHDDQP